MRNNSFAFAAVLVSGLFATLALAQPDSALELPAKTNMNRFSVAYRMGFNITADFKRLGTFIPPNNSVNPGPATGGNTDRTYDDGYVKRDIRENALGLTWNWGYDNESQVPGNDTIQFHSASAVGKTSSKDVDGDPQHGFEFLYQRRIREIGKGWFGMEAGIGFANLTFEDHRPLAGRVSLLTDTYQLGGVVPPTPPYRGDFTNAGPLIEDSPTRTIESMSGGVTITGRRTVDANLMTLRLGPVFELPVSEKLSFLFSGGLAVGAIDCDFRFTETVTIANSGSVTSRGHSSDTGLLLGGYLAGTAVWKFNDTWDAFGSAQFQSSDSYSQSASGKKVDINMGQAIFLSFGVGASF